jgi:hypothetical protein
MGSTFTIVARLRSTDAYAEEPILTIDAGTTEPHALGVMKREVYAFGLRLTPDFDDVKCLYLYCGRWRLVRAEFVEEDSTLHVEFRTEALRAAWFDAEERLAARRWPLRGRLFNRAFVADFDDTKRRQLVYRPMVPACKTHG